MTTSDRTHDLAQLNVARLHHPLEDPRTAPFVDALDEINALAESSDGFVWRLTGDDGQSSSYVSVSDDPLLIINLSVWASPDALRAFVYQSEHRDFLRRRTEWFQPPTGPFAVCWWVPCGHEPSEIEAMEKLAKLKAEGPGEDVFGFRPPFPPPPSA